MQPLHGVPVPSNPKHVVYVWIDALLNMRLLLVMVKRIMLTMINSGVEQSLVGEDILHFLNLLANPSHDVGYEIA